MSSPSDGDAVVDKSADSRNAEGFVTYAFLIDPQKRVMGYRLGWRTDSAINEANALAQFKALAACVAENLSASKGGWRLGRAVLFLDITVEFLASSELQLLPPEHVVLCISPHDLIDADARPMLLFRGQQGYRFMLCCAEALPDDLELNVLITHFDVGAGDRDFVARLQRNEQPGQQPMHLIATRLATWDEFNACAMRGVGAFVDGELAHLPVVAQPGHAFQPESLLIVRMMQMIQHNEDLREIEAALKQDAMLTYRLLRHINSPAMGVAVEIHSLRHAVTMLGYSPLFRWLSLLLATSNAKVGPPFMMKKAITRGRFVELLGAGLLPASESDNLFVVGMFSLIDQLLGVPIEEILSKVQLTESVQQAILKREGVYGPFLALVEACESESESESDGVQAARLSEALFMDARQVNAAHLSALIWAQDVSPSGVAY